MKKEFEDIKKGDIIRWEDGGYFTGQQERIVEGKALRLIPAKDNGLVDIWMADFNGVKVPVTPFRFRGIV